MSSALVRSEHPNSCGPIATGGDDLPTIRIKSRRIDRVLMSPKLQFGLACLYVPDSRALILTSRDHSSAVRAESRRVDRGSCYALPECEAAGQLLHSKAGPCYRRWR